MARAPQLAVIMLLWCGVVSSSVPEAEEADESSCLAIRSKGFGNEAMNLGHSRSDTSVFEASVDSIIEEAFKEVTGLGSNLVPMMPGDMVAQQCAKWNLAADPKQGSMMLLNLGEALGCEDEFKGDDTCKALNASLQATLALQEKYPSGPIFANYFVTNWYGNSWEDGSVRPNQSVMPPSADVVDPSGLILYGLCDILRTVLTQSPNQYGTGSCGWAATIGVLSYKAPAKAIKMGLRVMWTGRVVPAIPKPCDYILETQFPGLVPFKTGPDAWLPAGVDNYSWAEHEAACSGNAQDCAAASGEPSNPMGLTGMWSQSLISAYRQSIGETCEDPGSVWPMLYPGLSAEGEEANQIAAGQGFHDALWVCNAIVDPANQSCQLIFNPEICGSVDLETCREKLLQPSLTEKFLGTLEVPSFTEELLERACAAETAVLMVESLPLVMKFKAMKHGGEYDKNLTEENRQHEINHAVYLRQCYSEEDAYAIWTWGVTINMTKAEILGEPYSVSGLLEAVGVDLNETLNSDGIPPAAFNTGIVSAAIVSDGVSFARLT